MSNLYDLQLWHQYGCGPTFVPLQASSLFYLKPTPPAPRAPTPPLFSGTSQSVSLIVDATVGYQGNALSPPISPSNPLRVIVLFDDHFCTSAWRLTRRSGRLVYLEGMSAPHGSTVLRPAHLSAASLTPRDFHDFLSSAWHVQTQDFSPASLLQRVRTCDKTWPDGETNNHWPTTSSNMQELPVMRLH